MAASNPRLWESEKTCAGSITTGEARAEGRADRGLRPGHDRRGGSLQRRPRRPDHRHQHGLSREEGVQRAGGSALMRDEALAVRIIAAVVGSATCRSRSRCAPDLATRQHRNAVEVRAPAEQRGIAALTVHGRTRACGFGGERRIRHHRRGEGAVAIPVVANGDIDSPDKAREVLRHTGADAVMIGRAAQGRPWIFREDRSLSWPPARRSTARLAGGRQHCFEHLVDHYRFYGESVGVRTARKHIGWYRAPCRRDRLPMNRLTDSDAQLRAASTSPARHPQRSSTDRSILHRRERGAEDDGRKTRRDDRSATRPAVAAIHEHACHPQPGEVLPGSGGHPAAG